MGESRINIQVPELGNILRPWRKATDEKGVPPHVTLLYLWRRAPLRAIDIEQLRASIAGAEAFPLRFVEIERFTARALYLRIEDESQIRGLMRRIHLAFPDSPPYGGKFSDVIPHLTLAIADTEAELDRVLPDISRAMESYLPFSVEARAVAVMEEDEAGLLAHNGRISPHSLSSAREMTALLPGDHHGCTDENPRRTRCDAARPHGVLRRPASPS